MPQDRVSGLLYLFIYLGYYIKTQKEPLRSDTKFQFWAARKYCSVIFLVKKIHTVMSHNQNKR